VSARLSIVVAVLGLAFGPSAVHAQPAVDEAARRHFQSATALYEAGDYELALTEFQAAYDAKPHPTVLRNVAATQERLRLYPEAIRTLERFLAEATGAALRTERTAIEAHLVGLRSLVGRVEVVLAEPGFAIEVDGRATGTSPLPDPVEVPLGNRTVVARREGYEPESVQVRVEGGGTSRVELHPVARMARLTVDASAPHAVVSVDGAPPMPAPWSNAVMHGRHDVRVTAPGRRPSSLRVDLDPGAERSLVVQLEAGGPQGMLAIHVQPRAGARATVDGLPLELGRGATRTLEQGLHRVVVDGPDRATYEANLRVRANRVTRVRVKLDQDRFWVSPLWGTLAAVGTAIALGGTVYWGLAASAAANDYRDPQTPTDELAGLYDDRARFARSADAAAVTTLIIGAGAALLFYWSRQRPESTATVRTDEIE
jgi:hypothetical protein